MTEPRTRILASARALYLEGGMEAVTMRSVAKRVGVTATALYRHFDNKEDLLGELMVQAFETFGSYLYRALGGKTPMERFRRSAEAYLDFALEQREIYRTLFMSPVPRGKDGVPFTGKRFDSASTFQFLVDRIRECIDSGDLRKDEPEAVAVSVWAHVHGLVSLQICGSFDQADEAFRQAYRSSVERAMAGLAVPKGKGS
ncbi:MAG TPA: TetR/AcrR family transcriptional regulator [Myxococcaceae bacterium]|jgi:AcrR family transcriptional regulator